MLFELLMYVLFVAFGFAVALSVTDDYKQGIIGAVIGALISIILLNVDVWGPYIDNLNIQMW